MIVSDKKDFDCYWDKEWKLEKENFAVFHALSLSVMNRCDILFAFTFE